MPTWLARGIAYLFVGIVCAAGPILLLIAAVIGIQRAVFIHSSAKADGVIVGLRAVYARKSNKTWEPVFEFTARDGRTFTVFSNIGQGGSRWRPGQHVPVLYEPDDPENARIDAFAQLWMPTAVLGVVGAGFSALPLLVLIRRLRSG